MLTDTDLTINGNKYFAVVKYEPIGHNEDKIERGVYFGTPYTHIEHEFVLTDVEVLELNLYANDDDGTLITDESLIAKALVEVKKELLR